MRARGAEGARGVDGVAEEVIGNDLGVTRVRIPSESGKGRDSYDGVAAAAAASRTGGTRGADLVAEETEEVLLVDGARLDMEAPEEPDMGNSALLGDEEGKERLEAVAAGAVVELEGGG